MPRYKIILIRSIASIVYALRRSALRRSEVKWVVVTGSVGKTIARQTIAQTLKHAGTLVISPASSYVNELGVLCAQFAVTDFSIWSPSAWWRLLTNPAVSTGYICIELGADFRLDIPWFLKRFVPYIVVVTVVTEQNWTGMVPQVKYHRAQLMAAARGYVLVDSHCLDIDRSDVYAFPVSVARTIAEREGVGGGVYIEPYHHNRQEIITDRLAVIVRDTYKVTPLCLEYSLRTTLAAVPPKKIFIMTEIRPRLIPLPSLYETSLTLLRQFDEVYFIGDKQVYLYLHAEFPLVYVSANMVETLVTQLTKRILSGETLAIGIKTAQFYHVPGLGLLGKGS